MKKRLKSIVSIGIVVLTIAAFSWYLTTHPTYVKKLQTTSPLTIILLLLINAVLIAVLTVIYYLTIRLSGAEIGRRENFLLTIYSSVANFFGPLQSGPGVRAVYLKKRLGVSLRAYTFVTLIYYAMFAVISAFFLLVGTRPWWQTTLAVIAASGVSYGVLRWFQLRKMRRTSGGKLMISARLLLLLLVFTILQLSLVSLRYYTELRAVHAPISIGQAVSYSGAANFALFVSITPDGIGIRESFLLFSQRLHGVATQYIVGASLLDRASYILFLALLFLVALSLHAGERLRLVQQRHLSKNAGPAKELKGQDKKE